MHWRERVSVSTPCFGIGFSAVLYIQYNLPTPAKHGTDKNGRISQDPEYRRSYNFTQITHKACNKGTATPMVHIDPVFNLRFWRIWGEVLYNKGYQMIELFILMQLIQVLTPGSNLINFYEVQKEVGVRTSISHK